MSKSLYLLVAFFTQTVWASVLLPGFEAYFTTRIGQTQYIYHPEAREIIRPLVAHHTRVRQEYDRSFGWSLEEPQDLILTSYRHQVANAYATISPNIKSVWFPAGAGFLDEQAASSWLYLLDLHETAHVYQLNAKGRLGSTLYQVFGNVPYILFFGVPIFLHPNVFTPRFLLEGNAVLQESRFNVGGRLHSGEVRALVLAQIQKDQIQPNRLINDQFRFPFGLVDYLQGGYFAAHLAAKHGIEKTNQVFVAQGDHFLWPFILNKTFRQHFGASYPQEIREYVREWKPLADRQKSSESNPVLAATYVEQLNHDQGRIWFLSSDGKRLPQLHIIDKDRRTISTERLDLPLGQVYFFDGQPLSVSSQQHDLHHIEYSLYGEGARLDKSHRGVLLTDRRAGHEVGLDIRSSWIEPRLLLDGTFYDVAHSRAILDSEGHVYYFRQNGVERILYRDREPVFRYEGFYGKLTEVLADGSILFIGNTDAGSSLYQFKEGEIRRLFDSDRIVDARQIREDEFLLVEVGADGHAVFKDRAKPRTARPAHYSYGFFQETLLPDPNMATSLVEETSYNQFLNLRHSGIEFSSSLSNWSGLGASAIAGFTDPLEYNSLALGYATTQFRGKSALAQYTFSRFLLNMTLQYRYWESWWERTDGIDQFSYNQNVATVFTLPVLRWRRWDSSLSLAPNYEKEDVENDPTTSTSSASPYEEIWGIKSSFDLTYSQYPSLGMFAWQEFSLSYQNRLQSLTNQWTKRYNSSIFKLSYQHGLPLEMYITGYGQVAWAENRDIDVEFMQTPFSTSVSIPILTTQHSYTVKNAESARLEFHKVFNISSYPTRVFVGVDRLAPFVVAQGTFFDDDRYDRYPPDLFEWGYGVDTQLLLFHQIRSVVRVMAAYNTRYPRKADNQMTLNFKQSF
ncbi:MAG: hypothetical protein AB7F86_06985 [Bdellovibrionales bacterium]